MLFIMCVFSIALSVTDDRQEDYLTQTNRYLTAIQNPFLHTSTSTYQELKEKVRGGNFRLPNQAEYKNLVSIDNKKKFCPEHLGICLRAMIYNILHFHLPKEYVCACLAIIRIIGLDELDSLSKEPGGISFLDKQGRRKQLECLI